MSSQHRVDFLVLGLLLIVAVILSFFFSVNFLCSTALFLVAPALWISARSPQKILRALLFAFVFTIPFLIIVDHIAALDQAWHVPTIFSFRLLGTIPLEDFFVGLSISYLLSIFYEHFYKKEVAPIFCKSMWSFVKISIVALCIFFLLFFFSPEHLFIPYAYLIVGTALLIILPILFLFCFPSFFFRFCSAVLYFFPLLFAMEIIGLKLGHWSFPGTHFIGWVHLFGVQFPFEELLFWIILAPVSFFSYYEYFNNDRSLR
jgi:hypothetical protein